MKQLHIRRYAFVLTFFALVAGSSNAQELRPTFTVQTANGQAAFHIGERIPLKLTFTSPNDRQFLIAPWRDGRGGEFDFETFAVSPSGGWSDPLATYFLQDFIRTGHGWPWPPFLKAKPIEISLDLNQWIRFDHPGVYRVKITSHRVSSLQNKVWEQNALESNELELRIIAASSEWESATLKAILPNLDPRKPEYPGAAADLRYLTTPAGIAEMTNTMHAGDAYDISYESSMGLMGLPDSMRDVGIASMNKRIAEPNYPISTTFFRTMSLLHVSSGSSKENVREQLQSYRPALWQTVYSSVSTKEGAARAQTVQTLLTVGSNMNIPDFSSKVASLLAASLLDLDNRSQIDDLRQRWDMLRSPGILTVVETLAKLPALGDGDLGPYSRDDLKSVAFKRWYELDPVGARNEILMEIGTARPALSAQALRFMPEESLPEFESIWADAFVGTTRQLDERVLGSLLVRFGSGTATSRMIAKLNEPPRDFSCDSHVLALAYLVKFSAGDVTAQMKRQIMSGDRSCSGSLFRWISEYAAGQALNDAADEALNDGVPNVVIDAVQYLTLHGTKSDQKFIWERFVKWTEEWKGKGDVLDHPADGYFADRFNAQEGELLAAGMISNQGWVADQALISRVASMCIGKEVCDRINAVLANTATPYWVHLPDTSTPLGIEFPQMYAVAQYAVASPELLEAKVSQFPAGTKFVRSGASPSTDEQRKLEDEVRVIFKNYGMLLEKQTN